MTFDPVGKILSKPVKVDLKSKNNENIPIGHQVGMRCRKCKEGILEKKDAWTGGTFSGTGGDTRFCPVCKHQDIYTWD